MAWGWLLRCAACGSPQSLCWDDPYVAEPCQHLLHVQSIGTRDQRLHLGAMVKMEPGLGCEANATSQRSTVSPMLGLMNLVGGPVIAGYPSDAQWKESGLLTSPHCCLSSVCPRPCLIHRMNFVHISQTSPSTWATQGNSSIQVRGGLPLQPHSLGLLPNCPFRLLLQECQIHTGLRAG